MSFCPIQLQATRSHRETGAFAPAWGMGRNFGILHPVCDRTSHVLVANGGKLEGPR